MGVKSGTMIVQVHTLCLLWLLISLWTHAHCACDVVGRIVHRNFVLQKQ